MNNKKDIAAPQQHAQAADEIDQRIASQVSEWQREIARLQDLVAHAMGNAQAALSDEQIIAIKVQVSDRYNSAWHLSDSAACEFARAIIAILQSAPAKRREVPAAPDRCPISGREFWGNIDHPKLGYIATYGGPFDTYSIPYLDEDDELRVERFDQDRGEWVDGGEPYGWFYREQQ